MLLDFTIHYIYSTVHYIKFFDYIFLKDHCMVENKTYKMKLTNQKFNKVLILIGITLICDLAQAQVVLGTYASKSKYISNSPFSYFEISFDGEIRISNDDQGIESMSPGSYLKISRASFGNKRKLELRGSEGGKIVRRYFEGRNELTFEPDGADWLADILIEVIRTTGIDAKGRVDRFYRNSGVNGVLDEISEIESSSGKGRYFDALLLKELSSQDLAEIASSISSLISSSSEKGNLYRRHSKAFLVNDQVTSSYFRGISRISSNSERGSVLNHILENDLTETQFKGVLNVVESISSSSEKGSVLRHVNKASIENMNISDEYFEAINSISSSSEIGSVLRDLLSEVNLNDEMLTELFYSVGRMSSSTEMGSVLKFAIKKNKITNLQNEAFFNALDEISSDSEAGTVLRSLIQKGQISISTKVMLIQATGNLSSNTEIGRILRDAVAFMDNTSEINEAYFEVVGNMSSSTEMGSVLRSMLNTKRLTDITLIPLFRTTSRMSSNTEIGRVVRTAIETYKLSTKATLALLETIEELSSDSEMGSCLRALAADLPKDNSQLLRVFKEVAASLSSDSEYRRVMDALVD